MNDQISLVREILRQLLVQPQKGSRLRPLLEREFEKRTGISFRAAFWSFPKFLTFLEANSDILDIVKPNGPGDITVQLRQDVPSAPVSALPPPTSLARFLPSSVWNAFTNPDLRRRRFFSRLSGEIVHYIEGSQTAHHLTIASVVANDSNYVEITPVSAEQQSGWLKEFLASVRVPESKQELLNILAETPYSSAVNTAFIATLEDLGEEWRQFRASRVHEAVRAWAESQNIPLDQVLRLPSHAIHGTVDQHGHGSLSPASQESSSINDLRLWLHALIDKLDSTDASQILLPASTLFKLTGGRR